MYDYLTEIKSLYIEMVIEDLRCINSVCINHHGTHLNRLEYAYIR